MNMTLLISFLVGGFALGSIPFALLLGRTQGVDIRTLGSGNPGATNLGRHLGFKWFLICFALDAVKGLTPVLVYGLIAGTASNPALPPAQAFAWLGVMIAPVLGHMFSPWIGFKGGKGVATGLGALLGVFPVLTVAGAGAFVVFISTLTLWRYMGLSSVLAAGSLPIWVWYFGEVLRRGASTSDEPPPITWPYLVVTIALAALVIYKHRGNLSRMADGVAPKVGSKPDPAPTSEPQSETSTEPIAPKSPPSGDDT